MWQLSRHDQTSTNQQTPDNLITCNEEGAHVDADRAKTSGVPADVVHDPCSNLSYFNFVFALQLFLYFRTARLKHDGEFRLTGIVLWSCSMVG